MKRYIKSTTEPKILSLDMFDVDEHDFKTPYAEQHCIDYLLNIDGYTIKIYMGFSKVPYSIYFKYPSGYRGEVGGFKTAEEAVNYLNEKKWWEWKEPTEEQIQRSYDYDMEMHKLNEEALRNR